MDRRLRLLESGVTKSITVTTFTYFDTSALSKPRVGTDNHVRCLAGRENSNHPPAGGLLSVDTVKDASSLHQVARVCNVPTGLVLLSTAMSLPSLPANVPSSDALRLAAERVIPDAEIIVKRVKGGYTGPVAMKPIALMAEVTRFTQNVRQFRIQVAL